MNIDAHAYNITVRCGEFEGEILYEARVKELPDLVEYGETFEEAYRLALDAIETTAGVCAEKGLAMPAAMVPAEDYSGRVTLRLAKSLHRALAAAADSEGVSLNQHLVNILSYYSGFAAGGRHEALSSGKSGGRGPVAVSNEQRLGVNDKPDPAKGYR
ncbi:toxin-antitoxin system HicB family antitoxin [Candidatus Thiosymbion oneisti]|uniref:toxin-antitoxin system HicB family antitoxin n=1 Tax=Candidatus Thiosymbion oneisti TaxID=589554 RepID=UPI000AD583D0|nr:toxin-antitoxin system HicB family antitoxin [Candidatus Thiosymbion oneisti]